MGNSGITVIGAFRHSILYSVFDTCVSMGNSELTLIGAIRNRLLYKVGDT